MMYNLTAGLRGEIKELCSIPLGTEKESGAIIIGFATFLHGDFATADAAMDHMSDDIVASEASGLQQRMEVYPAETGSSNESSAGNFLVLEKRGTA